MSKPNEPLFQGQNGPGFPAKLAWIFMPNWPGLQPRLDQIFQASLTKIFQARLAGIFQPRLAGIFQARWAGIFQARLARIIQARLARRFQAKLARRFHARLAQIFKASLAQIFKARFAQISRPDWHSYSRPDLLGFSRPGWPRFPRPDLPGYSRPDWPRFPGKIHPNCQVRSARISQPDFLGFPSHIGKQRSQNGPDFSGNIDLDFLDRLTQISRPGWPKLSGPDLIGPYSSYFPAIMTCNSRPDCLGLPGQISRTNSPSRAD